MNDPGIVLNQFIVREARDDEHEECRKIVPECFFPSAAPELFVAIANGEQSIAGVAALNWCWGGFPVHVQVLPNLRRRGIGTALIDAVTSISGGETPKLRSWFPVAENTPAARFLENAGFMVEQRMLGFETDGHRFRNDIQKLFDRLERTGKIPTDARTVRLNEASGAEVSRLVSEEFGTPSAYVAARMNSWGYAAYDQATSVVALRADRVVGAMLNTRNASTLNIDVNVVRADHRSGWTNVLLLSKVVSLGIETGIMSFRFFCEEDVRDTLNLAKRSGARELGVGLFYAKRLIEVGPEGF